MNIFRPSLPCLSTLLCKKPFTIPSAGPIFASGLLDEEISPSYDSKYFYPAQPGDVFADRYQALIKVGWGVSSTVWLARDMQSHAEQPETVMALKIGNNNATFADHEQEIEEHISTTNPSHHGRSLIRTFVDSFNVKGPHGSHLCLVYPPMREPLSMYQRRFTQGRMPLPVVKAYIRALLTGLDYLHKECRIAYTDLKPENIMVSFEDPTVLPEFLDSQLQKQMASKLDSSGRPVYQSRNDFGPLKSLSSIPQLADFGLATRLEQHDDWGVWPIQPDHYRAPEVILGNGWQMPADIWNLGVMLWDMVEGKELFQNIHDFQGYYNSKLHIAEMMALFGPPPPEIIQRYQFMRGYEWPGAVSREDGCVCHTAEEYFCGPFFDDNGHFIYDAVIPDRKLEDTVSSLEGEEKEAFLDLAKGMLDWHQDFRKAAGELATHPFLQPKVTSA